ncbi:MAG: rRNA maturation RNase YbeY [Pontiellaceae bacterium]|nr:rRNA maturation RNase YbeY [Pontiellaceae bacterium]
MKISIQNQQTNQPIQIQNLYKLAEFLGNKLNAATAPDRWSEVCVVLVDDEGITQVNRAYFEKDRPTDVISFRYDPIPGEENAWSGDLIINVDRAVQVGPEHHGIDDELALYMAHGFDHLSGAEDDTDEKRSRMLATETAWLQEAASLVNQLIG